MIKRHIFRAIQRESESGQIIQKMVWYSIFEKNDVKNDSFFDEKHKILIKRLVKIDSKSRY